MKKCAVGIAAERQVLGGEEGEVYMLPILVQLPKSDVPNGNGEGGFKVRYDIYEAVGCPPVTTEDELLDALKMMQDYERERTGTDDVYALHWWGQGGTFSPQILARMYGSNDCLSYFEADVETGAPKFFLEKDSNFMKAVRFYNKAWNMGLLDPDSFTMDNATWAEKIKNGKVLSATCWGDQPDPTICGENAILTYLPGPFGYLPGAYFDCAPVGRGVDNAARALSTNCKDPVRAMQFLAWLDSDFGLRVIHCGVPGVDWDYVDGVPQFIGEARAAYEAGEGGTYMNGRTLRTSDAVWYMCTGNGVETDDGYPVRLDKTIEMRALSSTPAQLHFAHLFSEDFFYQGQVYDYWIKQGLVKADDNIKAAMIRSFMPALTQEMCEESDWPCIGHYNEMAADICTCSVEEFDSMVDELWNYCVEKGMPEIIEYANQNYLTTKALIEEMLGE